MEQFYQHDKLAAYAEALDSDVGAKVHRRVVDGKVKALYGGTVYGAFVMTEKGSAFDTYEQAYENAKLFVEQAKQALETRALRNSVIYRRTLSFLASILSCLKPSLHTESFP